MHYIERDLMMNCLIIESQLLELAKYKKMMRQERAAQQHVLLLNEDHNDDWKKHSTIEEVNRISWARVSIILRQS